MKFTLDSFSNETCIISPMGVSTLMDVACSYPFELLPFDYHDYTYAFSDLEHFNNFPYEAERYELMRVLTAYVLDNFLLFFVDEEFKNILFI